MLGVLIMEFFKKKNVMNLFLVMNLSGCLKEVKFVPINIVLRGACLRFLLTRAIDSYKKTKILL